MMYQLEYSTVMIRLGFFVVVFSFCYNQTGLFYFVVTAQLPGANGYTGGKVVFIDTENTLYLFLNCNNLFRLLSICAA